MKKFIIIAFCGVSLCAQTLIGVAGGYKKPLEKIVQIAKDNGLDVAAIYSHPKQLLASQSADKIGVLISDQASLSLANNVKETVALGHGKLVFVSQKPLKTVNEIENLSSIAIPQPKKTIYGKAASEFIVRSGVKIQNLIEVASVPAVLAYVKSGEVSGGFVNLASVSYLRNSLNVLELDSHYYSPISIVAAKLGTCDTECDEFIAVLKSDKAKAIFNEFGLK